MEMNPLSIYIHVPFCLGRCGYCSFVSGIQATEIEMDEYTESLCRELELTAMLGQGAGREAETIYFGGGTPSLLGGARIARIIDKIQSLYSISNSTEITVEANPGSTVDDATLCRELIAAGVNRLSVGIQSFDDSELKLLGRPHDAAMAEKFFIAVKDAGFKSKSLDLIYGLPGQTEAAWQRNLERAAALNPDHVSLYCLELDEGVPLRREVGEKSLPQPDTDLQAKMYESTNEFLGALGFEHYEISNWSLPGHHSRHNMVYWTGGDYIGVGLGACGYVSSTRTANETDMEIYKKKVRRGMLPIATTERLSSKRRIRELAVMSLRTMSGLDVSCFEGEYEERDVIELKKVIEELVQEKLLRESDGMFALAPEALFVSDSIFSKMII